MPPPPSETAVAAIVADLIAFIGALVGQAVGAVLGARYAAVAAIFRGIPTPHGVHDGFLALRRQRPLPARLAPHQR